MIASACKWFAFAACALSAAALSPAMAASSTSSAVSDSIGTSLGSISDSLQTSSRSSTGKDKNESAQGEYRITEVAAAPGRPGALRLTMTAEQPQAGRASELWLTVPEATVEAAHLAPGVRVSALPRAYGVEFAQGGTRQAFFLALNDEWQRELRTERVGL